MKKTQLIMTVVMALVISTIATAQETTIDDTLSISTPALKPVDIGYGSTSYLNNTGAISTIEFTEFNQGNVYDPNLLIQGKAAGLSTFKKGADPNGFSLQRVRGLNTFGANIEPLVVVDGVIGATLANVDPNDIESVHILKDGAAASIYGVRATNGVILVKTKTGKRNQGISTEYNTYLTAANVLNEWPVMGPDEYIAAGGNDQGMVTDWQDEVSRTGFSQTHNVSIAGGGKNTVYRYSVNFRDVNGILDKSGFEQFNARANMTHYAVDDRLKLTANLSLTNRTSNHSFVEAFRYAAVYNPTSPVKFDNGNFWQAILFDNFNPEAIVQQNQNLSKDKLLNLNFQGAFQVTDQISVHANYANQFMNTISGEFYPNDSFFRGLYRDGLARRSTMDSRFTLFETYGNYQVDLNGNQLSFSLGYSFQEDENEQFLIDVGNFPTNDLGFNALELSADLVTGDARVSSNVSPVNRVVGFFSRLSYNIDNRFFLYGSLRRDGSNKLGENEQWGMFPSVAAAVDLQQFLNFNSFEYLKLRIGYGVTGNLPTASGLAQPLFQYSTFNGGEVRQQRQANPDLKWEEKHEFNYGVDLSVSNRLQASLDLYSRNVKDFINLVRSIDPDGFNFYDNIGELSTKGFDLQLSYDVLQSNNLSWRANLNLHRSKTILEAFTEGYEAQTRTSPGAPGQGGAQLTLLAIGDEIGQLWGPVFTGEVDVSGLPIMKDLNNDGDIVFYDPSITERDNDYKVLGSGNPDLELGISNQITYKNWDFNLFFRGAFGHSMVNLMRMFYEPLDPGAINSYNRISTDKAVDDLNFSLFSSHYVERADFLKLDNATVGYNITLPDNSAFSAIRFFFTVQNAFIITGYTGVDPDPIVADPGPIDNGGRLGGPLEFDVFSPGIDRRNQYLPERSFTLGVNVGF